MAPPKLNREAWLNKMMVMMRPWFADHGYPIHGRMSVTMAVLDGRARGVCMDILRTRLKDKAARAELQAKLDADETQIRKVFISAYDDSFTDMYDLVSTLVHETTHAILPGASSHGKDFVAAVTALGLIPRDKTKYKGAQRFSAMPLTPELRAYVTPLLDQLGPIPTYGLLLPPPKPKTQKKGGGDFKFQCPTCKTTIYMKFSSLNRAGEPPCWNPECDDNGRFMAEL